MSDDGPITTDDLPALKPEKDDEDAREEEEKTKHGDVKPTKTADVRERDV